MGRRLKGSAYDAAKRRHERYLARCGQEAAAERRRLAIIEREIAEGKRPHSEDTLEYVIMALIAAMWLYLALGGAGG